MRREIAEKNRILIVRPLEDKIDSIVAPEFKSEMIELINRGSTDVIINLSDVKYIDSSGLGVLVSLIKAIGEQGDLKFCGACERIKSLFELTRLNKIFSIYHSEDEAIDSFDS